MPIFQAINFTVLQNPPLLFPEAVSEGKFYGDGAKELGGMVKAKDNSWVGAYGAKAQ